MTFRSDKKFEPLKEDCPHPQKKRWPVESAFTRQTYLLCSDCYFLKYGIRPETLLGARPKRRRQ